MNYLNEYTQTIEGLRKALHRLDELDTKRADSLIGPVEVQRLIDIADLALDIVSITCPDSSINLEGNLDQWAAVKARIAHHVEAKRAQPAPRPTIVQHHDWIIRPQGIAFVLTQDGEAGERTFIDYAECVMHAVEQSRLNQERGFVWFDGPMGRQIAKVIG